jgi:hypothetical protein
VADEASCRAIACSRSMARPGTGRCIASRVRFFACADRRGRAGNARRDRRPVELACAKKAGRPARWLSAPRPKRPVASGSRSWSGAAPGHRGYETAAGQPGRRRCVG